MNNSNLTNNIFINSGCISAETLQGYVLGKLDSEKQNLVEKHIRSCQLCSDAVNGLKNDTGLENLDTNLSKLERQIRARVLKDQESESLNVKPGKSRIIRYAAIAAGILLIAGLFSLIYFYNRLDNSVLENNISLSNPPKPIIKSDTTLAEPESVNKKVESRQVSTVSRQPLKKVGKSNEIETRRMNPATESENLRISESKSLSEVSVDSGIQFNMKELHTKSQSLLISGARSKSVVAPIAFSNAANESINIKLSDETSATSDKAAGESLASSNVTYSPKSRKLSVQTSAMADMKEAEAFIVADKMPRFHGKGMYEFEKYVAEHLNYPKKAFEDKIEGIVNIIFTVDTLGNVIKVISLNENNELLQKEAIRVVSSSPKWEPGSEKGVLVNVQLTIPVRFRIK